MLAEARCYGPNVKVGGSQRLFQGEVSCNRGGKDGLCHLGVCWTRSDRSPLDAGIAGCAFGNLNPSKRSSLQSPPSMVPLGLPPPRPSAGAASRGGKYTGH